MPNKSKPKSTPGRRLRTAGTDPLTPPDNLEAASAEDEAEAAAGEDGGRDWSRLTAGMSPAQAVWHLHVQEGLPLAETALLLKLAPDAAQALHQNMLHQAAEQAPRSEGDFAALRHEAGQRLLAVYHDAAGDPRRQDPRHLVIRLSAMKQYSTLFGLNLEAAPLRDDAAPYTTPEDIAQAVRQRQTDQFGRTKDVTEAREALEAEGEVCGGLQ